MYLSKTPFIAKRFFRKIIWNIPCTEKILYLTFDDGPTPEITEWTLGVLKQFNAKASFFCIGKNIETHPETFRKIIAGNHTVGNHTYDHLNGWKTKTETYLNNVRRCEEVIGNQFPIAIGTVISEKQKSKPKTENRKPATLFRPPYGKITPSQYSILSAQTRWLSGEGVRHPVAIGSADNTQFSIIMWDVLSGDFDAKISGEKCYKNVVKNAAPGSIIVFHDSEKASKNLFYALPKTLEYFSEKGFRFEKI